MPEASFVNLILPWPENSVCYSQVETFSKPESGNWQNAIQASDVYSRNNPILARKISKIIRDCRINLQCAEG